MRKVQKLRRSIVKTRDLLDVMVGRAPAFILSPRPGRSSEIPVFYLHQEEAEWLEQVFSFLAENGYRSLTADDLYERILDGDVSTRNEIVLTVDDGAKHLWSVMFPLLKKYGLTVVAFVVPGLIDDGSGTSTRGPGCAPLCSWAEIDAMHRTGLVDFQSHSLYHNSIYVRPRIIGYRSPNWTPDFVTDWVFPVSGSGSKTVFPADLPLGTPIYESASRFERHLCLHGGEEIAARCQDYVAERGGSEFFDNPGWKRELDETFKRALASTADPPSYETFEERAEAIRYSLKRSKAVLEKRLANKRVRHFCFPWFVGSSLSAAISREVGYVMNYWGWSTPVRQEGHKMPRAVRRLHPLYIWRLPGRGRRSLLEVLRSRLQSFRFFGEGAQ